MIKSVFFIDFYCCFAFCSSSSCSSLCCLVHPYSTNDSVLSCSNRRLALQVPSTDSEEVDALVLIHSFRLCTVSLKQIKKVLVLIRKGMLGGANGGVAHVGASIVAVSLGIDFSAHNHSHGLLVEAVHGQIFDVLRVFVLSEEFTSVHAKDLLSDLTEAAEHGGSAAI